MCSINRTDPKAIGMYVSERAHQAQKRQARLSTADQQLASHYAFLAAALSSLDTAVYGRESRAQNQGNDECNSGFKQVTKKNKGKEMKQTGLGLRIYSDKAVERRIASF